MSTPAEPVAKQMFEVNVTETRLYGITYRILAASPDDAIQAAIEGPTEQQTESGEFVEVDRDFTMGEVIAIKDVRAADGAPIAFADPLNAEEEYDAA